MSSPKMRGSQFASGTLLDGAAVITSMAGAPLPCTIWVNPAPGDTLSVGISLDGGTRYDPWPNGDVTSTSPATSLSDALMSGVTHIKIQRTVGTGTASTWGIC